jgi:hypothetical protein
MFCQIFYSFESFPKSCHNKCAKSSKGIFSVVGGLLTTPRKIPWGILKNKTPILTGIFFSKIPCIIIYKYPTCIMGKKKIKKKIRKNSIDFLLCAMPLAKVMDPWPLVLGARYFVMGT